MSDCIYLGVKCFVVCINKKNGRELWRTKVKSSSLITIVVDGDIVVAHAGGELSGIDKQTGKKLWENGLSGLGYGHCMIATESSDSSQQAGHIAESIRAAQQSSNTHNHH